MIALEAVAICMKCKKEEKLRLRIDSAQSPSLLFFTPDQILPQDWHYKDVKGCPELYCDDCAPKPVLEVVPNADEER